MPHKRAKSVPKKSEDDKIMERLLEQLPTNEAMDEEIERIIQRIPTVSRAVSHRGPASSFDMSVDSSRPFMDLRNFKGGSNRRFHGASVRHLYEIMTAGYLNEIKKMGNNTIDFDVYINDVLKHNFVHDSGGYETDDDYNDGIFVEESMPMELSSAVSEWVELLKRKDTVFKNALRDGTPSDKIIRRGLLLSFDAQVYSSTIVNGNREVKTAGHILLLVLEVSGARNCKSFIVDNLTNGMYAQSVHGWISSEIRTTISSLFNDTHVYSCPTIWNQQPLHDLRGMCMSTSFRAVLLFALLKEPCLRIENQGDETKTEAQHIFKFMYYQMERMRLFFLQGMFGAGKIEPVYLPMVKEDGVSLHKVDTPYFWTVHIESLRALPNPIIGLDSVLRFLVDIGPDGPDFPYAKRYYFNCDLSFDFVMNSARIEGGTCIMSALFPCNIEAMNLH